MGKTEKLWLEGVHEILKNRELIIPKKKRQYIKKVNEDGKSKDA